MEAEWLLVNVIGLVYSRYAVFVYYCVLCHLPHVMSLHLLLTTNPLARHHAEISTMSCFHESINRGPASSQSFDVAYNYSHVDEYGGYGISDHLNDRGIPCPETWPMIKSVNLQTKH